MGGREKDGEASAAKLVVDRVEVVRFPNPGQFLVIGGVLPHFFDVPSGQFIMSGYVRVIS